MSLPDTLCFFLLSVTPSPSFRLFLSLSVFFRPFLPYFFSLLLSLTKPRKCDFLKGLVELDINQASPCLLETWAIKWAESFQQQGPDNPPSSALPKHLGLERAGVLYFWKGGGVHTEMPQIVMTDL